MIELPLSRGVVTVIDDEDADLAEHKWSYKGGNKGGYPHRSGEKDGLHRIILTRKLGREIAPGMVAHHKDGNTLNNRRHNLEEKTHAENMAHRRYGKQRVIPQLKLARVVRSGVKGVYPASHGRWRAQFYYQGVLYSTRECLTIEEAQAALEQLRQTVESGTHPGRRKTRKLSLEEKQQREQDLNRRRGELRQKRTALLRHLAHQKRRKSYQRYDEASQGMIAILPLTKGEETLIDVADTDLEEYCWHTHNGYVVRTESGGGRFLLHRVILERKLGRPLKPEMQVDHINRKRLDNRRSNLREADYTLNRINHGRRSDNTSGYIGVSKYAKKEGWWVANIKRGQRLGIYPTREEAALAYNAAAIEAYGEAAVLNTVPSTE